MSQMTTRKSGGTDEKEKEKSQTDNTIKDMKKKMAANAEKEKEKQATEKQPEKNDKSKPADKPAEKTKAPEKPVEKPKATEKPAEKPKIAEKPAEKPKTVEKPAEKPAEKNGVEKKVESKDKKEQEKKEDKPEKNGKSEAKKNGNEKPKQNGAKHNGESNGVDDTGASSEDEEFPELTYEESDTDSPAGNSVPSRSQTRRSQVKPTRTPETPQPAADKPTDSTTQEESKDSKVLKLNEAPPSTDRKLRSADSPKPESKKEKERDTPKKDEKKKGEEKENGEDVIIEIEDDEPRKTDTNFSKSRVKVSPYRRSTRLADHTTTSVMANYTGNNTTMEMDITESSILSDDGTLNDSSYLSGLRSIRGRRSYKPLKEMTLRHVTANRSTVSNTNTESTSRPTAPVVGRKRKPEMDTSIELAFEASEAGGASGAGGAAHGKRMRLLDRIAHPFRRTLASTPLPARRNAEIVGLNTDLPLTAPVSSPLFDPESLKQAGDVTPPSDVTPPTPTERDGKRCVVM